MAAPLGNQNGTKLKDPNIRQIAYEQYCSHLAAGNSKKSWCFEHPEFTCTWKTMENYIKDEVEFSPVKKQIAEIKGFAHWERMIQDTASGKNKDGNVAAQQMVMRNKYRWDRVDQIFDDEQENIFSIAHDRLMDQLARHQKGKILSVTAEPSD